jgi:drug/metabolite transporter (DMT)-like permease
MRGYFLIALASIIWGTMGIFAKFAFGYGISPINLTAFRILISSTTIFLPLLLFKRRLLKIQKRDLPKMLAMGLFAVAFQRIAYFYAVDLTTATMAAMLFYTYPIFVTVYASLFLKEKISLSIILAIVLTLIGVGFVVKIYETPLLTASFYGLIFGMLGSILFALYFLITRRLRGTYTSWTLLVYGDGIGALALVPILFSSVPEIATYPQQLWYLIFAIALFPSLTAYLLFSYALKYVESSKGSILSVIEPLSAAVFSWTILGENFQAMQLIGAALALSGIVLLFNKTRV